MTKFKLLEVADAGRRAAMVTANPNDLASYLHDHLRWTHSSGKTEGKAAILDSIASGTVIYRSLEVREPDISQHGDLFIYSGIISGDVVKNVNEKKLSNKFLSVWQLVNAKLVMLAWQSTGL